MVELHENEDLFKDLYRHSPVMAADRVYYIISLTAFLIYLRRVDMIATLGYPEDVGEMPYYEFIRVVHTRCADPLNARKLLMFMTNSSYDGIEYFRDCITNAATDMRKTDFSDPEATATYAREYARNYKLMYACDLGQ
jgi:hypothetical protein